MSSFDNQIHSEEVSDICPYCDRMLDGVVVNGMHACCNEQYSAEIDAIYAQTA
jgi:hypothetical protein